MSSIYIILKQFKEGNLSEEEAVQLIRDLYNKDNYFPVIFPTQPKIPYTFPSYYYIGDPYCVN